LAARAAVVAEVGAVVPRGRAVLAPPAPAPGAPALPDRAELVVLVAQRPAPAAPHQRRELEARLPAQLAVVVGRVAVPAVALLLLLSRLSSSAAMARSST
jgi:hypothetical protein